MESEFLTRISSSQRAFLTRTAALERMSGPLCEAVLALPGSAAVLAELASSNLLLVPLDRRGQWYRGVCVFLPRGIEHGYRTVQYSWRNACE